MTEKIRASPFFAIQLDESTDVAQCPQLLVYTRYICQNKVEEDFLFCKALTTTTKGEDIMQMVSTFFDEEKLLWSKLVGICTDGAPAMLGVRSGFVSLSKRKNPNVITTHCMIHREALAAKTLPTALKETMEIVIQVRRSNTLLLWKFSH